VVPPHRTFTRADVERIAELARLSVTDAEAERLASELEAVLAYAEQLAGLDTSDVPPTSHPIELATPLREDVPEPPLDPELALANAPEREGSAFVVPKVIGGEEEG
jgi:aspartyl-tRNA(Asn)/glutamyl-tRNA(Gln) amidotransferase subunit C